VPLAPEILELLEDLATALSRRRWYVFGAQAANVYGRPRLSADVDVTVALGDEDSSRLVADLAEAGFALRVADEGGFLARTRVLPFSTTWWGCCVKTSSPSSIGRSWRPRGAGDPDSDRLRERP
jgi:hypothetical protein